VAYWEVVLNEIVGPPTTGGDGQPGSTVPVRTGITTPDWVILLTSQITTDNGGVEEKPTWDYSGANLRFGVNPGVMKQWRTLHSFGTGIAAELTQVLNGGTHPAFNPGSLQQAADRVNHWQLMLGHWALSFNTLMGSFGPLTGPWAGNAANIVRMVMSNLRSGFTDLGQQLLVTGGSRQPVTYFDNTTGDRPQTVADLFLSAKTQMEGFARTFLTQWAEWGKNSPATLLDAEYARTPPFRSTAGTTNRYQYDIAGITDYYKGIGSRAKATWETQVAAFDTAMTTAGTQLDGVLSSATAGISLITRPRDLEPMPGTSSQDRTADDIDLNDLLDNLVGGPDGLGGPEYTPPDGPGEDGGGGGGGPGAPDYTPPDGPGTGPGGGLDVPDYTPPDTAGGAGSGGGLGSPEYTPPGPDDGFDFPGLGGGGQGGNGNGQPSFVPPSYVPPLRQGDSPLGDVVYVPPVGVGAGGLATGGAAGAGTGRFAGGPAGAAGLSGTGGLSGGVAGGGAAAARALAGPAGAAGGGVPIYPPMAGGMGAGAGERRQERERTTWLAEDSAVWGTDPTAAPGVIGRPGPADRDGRRREEYRSTEAGGPDPGVGERMRER
jgi:hypothetical protein